MKHEILSGWKIPDLSGPYTFCVEVQFRSGSRPIVVMPAVANQLGAAAGLLSTWFAVNVFLSTPEKGAQY